MKEALALLFVLKNLVCLDSNTIVIVVIIIPKSQFLAIKMRKAKPTKIVLSKKRLRIFLEEWKGYPVKIFLFLSFRNSFYKYLGNICSFGQIFYIKKKSLNAMLLILVS